MTDSKAAPATRSVEAAMEIAAPVDAGYGRMKPEGKAQGLPESADISGWPLPSQAAWSW